MGNQLKLDLISLAASLAIHAALLSVPAVREAFTAKVYQIVSVVPLTFDTAVESDLLGVKPSEGNSEKAPRKDENTVTRGRSSKARKNLLHAKTSNSKELKGPFRSNSKAGVQAVSGSRWIKTQATGKGGRRLSLSAQVNTEEGRGTPKVASNRLVPYLIALRNRIMERWKAPFYRSEKGSQSVIIALTIGASGKLRELEVERLSPDIAFNRSALSAVYSAEPFPPLPKGVNSVRVKVKFEVK
ncbi:energy transducer TonB [Thermovibrio ammonificans]|uniref:TonB family protein n=1 Tax=Thermovibrio ammonificans (strain DSM 15698 / JCM 12110 / HB-1) TaxID=648996 RepID=E8T5G7_THEA1|nr:energy transducer TonB [Thermovibrio ammonificans]ADU97621.1 TonB family protein [Thermovibrio ammonificans HB-1]